MKFLPPTVPAINCYHFGTWQTRPLTSMQIFSNHQYVEYHVPSKLFLGYILYRVLEAPLIICFQTLEEVVVSRSCSWIKEKLSKFSKMVSYLIN